MKTIIKNIFALLCAISALVACEHKPIYEQCICNNSLAIPVRIDWSVSGVNLQNVTILFYNTGDGTLAKEHTFEANTNSVQSYVYLPVGSYTAVVFNELRNQIDYISCVGHETLMTLKFEGNDDDPVRSRGEARSYIKQSGDLAVATVQGIVVTEEMIVEAALSDQQGSDTKALSADTRATIESLLDVKPMKKTTVIEISAHVKNIYYARMPALVDLVNLADGYYVYGDKNSEAPSTIQFTMNNRSYDSGSYYDGTISVRIVTFGTLVDRHSTSAHDSSTPITLDLLFKMVDKEQSEENLAMDVTNLVEQSEESDGSILMTIDAAFEQELPEVEPEESAGGSGFDADLEEWDDVVVPL